MLPADARRSLFIYNLFFPLVFVALLPGFLLRMLRRGGYREKFRQRLGHYTAATPGGEPAEIAISRTHLRKHGWQETLHTLLHEMVHQWQDESGHAIDHGATFRAKAREVGIAPYARRVLATRPGRGDGSQSIGRRAARR